jgi:hypothetical protein
MINERLSSEAESHELRFAAVVDAGRTKPLALVERFGRKTDGLGELLLGHAIIADDFE